MTERSNSPPPNSQAPRMSGGGRGGSVHIQNSDVADVARDRAHTHPIRSTSARLASDRDGIVLVLRRWRVYDKAPQRCTSLAAVLAREGATPELIEGFCCYIERCGPACLPATICWWLQGGPTGGDVRAVLEDWEQAERTGDDMRLMVALREGAANGDRVAALRRMLGKLAARKGAR